MQIHQLSSTNSKNKKRVARGGAHGVFSGRGAKGQKSRAGRNFQPIMRQFVKRYPKMRGYRLNLWNDKSMLLELSVVLEKYSANEIVSPKSLVAKGLLTLNKGYYPNVKILGTAKVDKAIKVSGVNVSESVKKAIEDAGGKVIMTSKKVFKSAKGKKAGDVKNRLAPKAEKAAKPKKEKTKKAAVKEEK